MRNTFPVSTLIMLSTRLLNWRYSQALVVDDEVKARDRCVTVQALGRSSIEVCHTDAAHPDRRASHLDLLLGHGPRADSAQDWKW